MCPCKCHARMSSPWWRAQTVELAYEGKCARPGKRGGSLPKDQCASAGKLGKVAGAALGIGAAVGATALLRRRRAAQMATAAAKRARKVELGKALVRKDRLYRPYDLYQYQVSGKLPPRQYKI